MSLYFIANLFAKAYGGSEGDYAHALTLASDGGYLLTVQSLSFGASGADFLLVKVDALGQVVWTRMFGGSSGDGFERVIRTSDGGYLALGSSDSFGTGGDDFIVVKLSSSGNIEWIREIGGGSGDVVADAVQTSDGGFVVVGDTYSFGAGGHDFLVVKLSSTGSIQWAKTIGGVSNEGARAVAIASDGGLFVMGETASFGAGGDDLLLVKLSLTGSLQWARVIGGSSDEWGYSLVATPDGGALLAGLTGSWGAGLHDGFLVKVSSTGSVDWAEAIGGPSFEHIHRVVLSSSGDFVGAGWTASFGSGGYDAWLLAVGPSGALKWSATFGGSDQDYAYDIVEDADGFASFGHTYAGPTGSPDAILFKVGPDGAYENCVLNPTPTVTAVSPTVSSPSLVVQDAAPFNNSLSLSVTNPTPQVFDLCTPLFVNAGEGSGCGWFRRLVPAPGGLKVLGYRGRVEVYAPSGRLVLEDEVQPGAVLRLEPGVYFVIGERGALGKGVVR